MFLPRRGSYFFHGKASYPIQRLPQLPHRWGGRWVALCGAALVGALGFPLGTDMAVQAAIVTVGVEADLEAEFPSPLSTEEQERLEALQSTQMPHILSDISPDGTTLLVALLSTTEPPTLHFLDLETGTLTEVPDLPLDLQYEVVNPTGPIRWVDNNTLRFLQQDPYGLWRIITFNRATGMVSRTQVSSPEESGEILGVSPDFSKLAIRIYAADEDVVFLVFLDTLKRLEVARLPQDVVVHPPAWSADGQHMALVTAAADTDRSPNSPNWASALVQDALGRTPPQDNPLRQHNAVRLFDLSQAAPLGVELRADQGNGDSFAAAHVSPDGRRLLVKRQRPARIAGRPHPTYQNPDSAYYQIYDQDGTLLHTIDDPALQSPTESEGWFLGSDRLLFWAAYGHNRPLWIYDLSQQRLQPVPLPPGSVDPTTLALSPDGDTVIYGFSSVTQPPELFRFRAGDTAPPTALTQINADLQAVNRVQYQPVQFTTANGPRQGFLVQPAGQAFPPQQVPLVFWQEGGPGIPMSNQFATNVETPLNLLPNFGIAVLVVPLTGREGFGPAFYRAQAEGQNFGHIDLAEGRDIVQQMVQQGWANAGQIGVSGCSYGGYYAAQSLRQFPGLFAAANPQCSLLDALTEWQLGYSDRISYLVGQAPMENPSAYLTISPLYGATQITTPTLIFHGTEDFLPIDIVRNFHDMLEAAGAPVTLYEFENTGHGIDDPQLQNIAAQLQIQFFRQYLMANPSYIP